MSIVDHGRAVKSHWLQQVRSDDELIFLVDLSAGQISAIIGSASKDPVFLVTHFQSYCVESRCVQR